MKKQIAFLALVALCSSVSLPVMAENDVGIEKQESVKEFRFEIATVSEFELSPVLVLQNPEKESFYAFVKSPAVNPGYVKFDITKQYVSTRIRNNGVFGLIITYNSKLPKKNKGKPVIRFL